MIIFNQTVNHMLPTRLTRSAFLGEVWRAGYPLGAPPRNLYFAHGGRLRRPPWAKKKILGGGETATEPPPHERQRCPISISPSTSRVPPNTGAALATGRRACSAGLPIG